MDRSPHRQIRDLLAAARRRLTPQHRLRPAVVTARSSWLLLADGRPALRPVRRPH